ncbi:MAG: GNAT family N-acetyltransferase [Jiangellales bacterium]
MLPIVIASHVPGPWHLRRPTTADAAALLALCHADERHAIGRTVSTLAEVDELLHPAHTSLDADQWLAVPGDGGGDRFPVGWAIVWDHGNSDHQDVDVFRDPARADEHLRGELLDLVVARLAERASLSSYPLVHAAAGAFADDLTYRATLESRGFVHARTYHRMRMELDGELLQQVPAGVDLAPFDFEAESRQALHRVVEESFVDHFGYTSVSYADYWADADAEPAGDRDFWRVARVDGRIVGVSRASGRNAELGGGYVAELAVLPSHRGRGIAKALLTSTFEAYRRAGRTWGGLMVDTENTTGALGLYTSIGMAPTEQIYDHTRDVLAS